MAFCRHCGTELPGDARFCASCGKVVWVNFHAQPPLAGQPVQNDGNFLLTLMHDVGLPDGRFSRGRFALVYFGMLGISFIISVMTSLEPLFGLGLALWFFVQFFVLIISGIRRLHDLSRSGWYVLLLFVPLVNIGMFLFLLLMPGTKGANKWGY